LDRLFFDRFAGERLFDLRRSVGLGTHAGDADARRGDGAIGDGDYRAHAGQRVVGGRLVELLVRRAGARRLHVEADLANDLLFAERGRQHVDEEAVEVEVALAA